MYTRTKGKSISTLQHRETQYNTLQQKKEENQKADNRSVLAEPLQQKAIAPPMTVDRLQQNSTLQLQANGETEENTLQAKLNASSNLLQNGFTDRSQTEDYLQAKFKNTAKTPVQRMIEEEEDEHLLQGKFKHLTNIVQRKGTNEDEALLQGKFSQTPIQQQEAKPNNTGLPSNLKSGIEQLSGYSMDDVNVHYNSSKPAQLQAHAYAQGTDIHLEAGQEKHLPHEAWHVVQQKQGRVKQTAQLKGVGLNDDVSLEREADVMGRKAMGSGLTDTTTSESPSKTTQLFASISNNIVQRAKRFSAVTYVDDGYQRGHKMEATNLNINNIGGGSETAGIDIGGSNKVVNYKATQGSPFCVQMHLLNRKLGGNGQDAQNLGWGSTAMNSQHKYKIENFLNTAIEEHQDAKDHQKVIDYYRVRVDYYQPTDTSNRERAKGAMIEKLYYEARYRPSPGAEMETEKGMLQDDSGISQMDNLVQNEESMNDNWVNHVPDDVHLTYKDGGDVAPNVYTSSQEDLMEYYEDIDAKIAARTRKPQPPKPITYKCEKKYEDVKHQLEYIFNDVYNSHYESIEKAVGADFMDNNNDEVEALKKIIQTALEEETKSFLLNKVVKELAKSDDRVEAMNDEEQEDLVSRLQENNFKEDLEERESVISKRINTKIRRTIGRIRRDGWSPEEDETLRPKKKAKYVL